MTPARLAALRAVAAGGAPARRDTLAALVAARLVEVVVRYVEHRGGLRAEVGAVSLTAAGRVALDRATPRLDSMGRACYSSGMTNTDTATRPAFRVLGTTDDVTECECCGRTDLRSTVRLGALDADGNVEGVTYYGRACGARAAGWTVNELRRAVTAAERAAVEAARAARAVEAAAKYAAARALDGTADCYMGPTICRRTLRGACIAHPAAAAAPVVEAPAAAAAVGMLDLDADTVGMLF